MRLLRLVPLLALPFLFLGATCVTRVDQKGPAGPWVGEVTNNGSDPILFAHAYGQVLYGKDEAVGIASADVCPFELFPGKKGYFSVPALPSALPLHLSLMTVLPGNPVPTLARNVSFRTFQTYAEHSAILVEARNNSSNTYYHLWVCAVNFASPGAVREVSAATPFLGIVFKPGDVVVFPVQFTSPVDGTFQFSAYSTGTDIDTVLSSVPFDYSTKLVETEKGRELEVVGEITNTSATDLEFTWYQAYLASSPTVRKAGFVGSNSVMNDLGGTGVLPAGQKTLLAFTLPLDANDTNTVNLEGIGGKTSRFTFSPVTARDVASEGTGTGTVRVSATLSNPRDEGLVVDSLCFELRGARGKLAGGQCIAGPWIRPHGMVDVSQMVPELRATNSAAVVAYGHASPKPPQVTPPS